MQQQPSIMTAFLLQRVRAAERDSSLESSLGETVSICLRTLLAHVDEMSDELGKPSGWMRAMTSPRVEKEVVRDRNSGGERQLAHLVKGTRRRERRNSSKSVLSRRQSHLSNEGERSSRLSSMSNEEEGSRRLSHVSNDGEGGGADQPTSLRQINWRSSSHDSLGVEDRPNDHSPRRHTQNLAAPQGRPQEAILMAVELILQTASLFEASVLNAVLPVWLESESSSELLSAFTEFALPRILSNEQQVGSELGEASEKNQVSRLPALNRPPGCLSSYSRLHTIHALALPLSCTQSHPHALAPRSLPHTPHTCLSHRRRPNAR